MDQDELFWTGGGDVEGVPNTCWGGSSPGTPGMKIKIKSSRAPVLTKAALQRHGVHQRRTPIGRCYELGSNVVDA